MLLPDGSACLGAAFASFRYIGQGQGAVTAVVGAAAHARQRSSVPRHNLTIMARERPQERDMHTISTHTGADAYALRNHPNKLFVETTTRCNMSCVMCVKQAEGCGITEGDLPPEIFAALEPAFATLEALVLNGVGEPLLHPHLEEFVARARALMPEKSWIGFQSNGLLLDENRAKTLLQAGLDKICLSLDAVSPQTFKRIREGGQLLSIEGAFDAVAKAKEALGNSTFELGIEFVVMPSNLAELPAVIAWAARRGATFAIVTHALPYQESETAEVTYETCSTEAIDLFRKWQAKAAAEDLDFYLYPRVVWKYAKSPEEQKIIGFAERMKAEAEQSGIYLDLKKLFSLDLEHVERTAQIFREARQAADACGIDLKLPELLLKENRRCDFVEEGGMFVSWDGKVFPCYFLWHHYHCFASGWLQTVRPKSFGNLAEQNVLEIWNTGAYQAFRKNVTRYDYPYCASCSLSPCDYIQTESFEQDCHVNEEPCGSCLWCMGIFQCLR
jgi:putative metalloenzyme radical SAM/SPASM domain maturase